MTAETSAPTPFQEPRRVRFGIKAELLLAFAAMTAMTVVASVVAWYAFAEVDRAVTRITGSSVPSMSRAHALAAEVTEITASAPVMMASATQEGRVRARRALTATEEKLSSLMEELATLGADRAALRELQTLQADMAANLAALDGFVERRLTLGGRREDAVRRLAATHRRVLETLEPLIDDAVFDTVMTSERIAQGTAGRITRLVDGGVANAQRLMEIKAEVNYAAGLLAEVANVSDPDLIEPIVERFVASTAALERNLGALPDTPETARARREVEDLLFFGRGGDNIFETRRDELTGVAGAVSAAGLSDGARTAHGRLLVTLAPLVDDAIFDVVISSEQAARDGQGAITRLVDGGVEKMRALLTMRADVNLAAGLLNEASGVSDGSLIQPLRERFIAARSRITRVLTRQLTSREMSGLEEVVYSLVATGAGAGNVFELRREELDQIAHAQDALGEGGAIAARLGDVTRRLVDVAQAASQDDRVRAQETIGGGRILLLIIIAATVSGAISIVVFYVAPRVVQPLLDMTHAMVRLAAGDTSVTVPAGDRKDEVGQMAEAFKVFRDTAQARANLSRYFSPKLVEELAGRDQPLGPVRRQNVAVLFADIVGFTGISENQPPEMIMALLRDFHGRMEKEVFEHNGVMEKFIGDALLATFGVPEPGPADALDALRCALAMLDSLARWNRERVEVAQEAVRIGIGLNFGPAVLGDIGSERNMAFAVIGDTTNTTSRLEGLSRDLDCDIVASDAFVSAARRQDGDDASRLLAGFQRGDYHALKGREEKVLVWTFRAAEI